MKLGILFRNISDFCNSEIWQTLKPWVAFLVITILWAIFYALRSNRKKIEELCKKGRHSWSSHNLGKYCKGCGITYREYMVKKQEVQKWMKLH